MDFLRISMSMSKYRHLTSAHAMTKTLRHWQVLVILTSCTFYDHRSICHKNNFMYMYIHYLAVGVSAQVVKSKNYENLTIFDFPDLSKYFYLAQMSSWPASDPI